MLDTAGYGPVAITKPVAIISPPGVTGLVTARDGNGVTVDVQGNVTLRGLYIEGSGGYSGVEVKRVGTLFIDDVTIRNFGVGVFVFSTSSSRVILRGGVIRDSLNGVNVWDSADNISIDVVISNSEITGSGYAIVSGRSYTGSSVRVLAAHSLISGSNRSSAPSATSPTAVSALNKGAEAVVDGCIFTKNDNVFNATGGNIYTRGNNTIYNNTVLGSTPTALPAQ